MSKAIIAESHYYIFTVLMLFMVTLSVESANIVSAGREVDNQIEETGFIRPYSKNRWYWEYKGEPVILRGGSDDDNLWQWTAKRLTDHLDLLQSLGGNYLRNTMSDRTEGNVFAHAKNNFGMYDLEVWNDEYWNRLDFFLDQTKKRDIIGQVTLWDWFDLAGNRFSIHPLNPENNVNWEHGVLTGRDDYYDGSLRTGNQEVLDYQHIYIDKLLSITFKHNHVYNLHAQDKSKLQIASRTGSLMVIPIDPGIESKLPVYRGSPVIYDNDDHRDVYTDEYLLALSSIGEIDFKGIITTYSPLEYPEFVEGREMIMDLATTCGLQNMPELFSGTSQKLVRPEDNRIEDTEPLDIDGSRFIVEIARQCSYSRPLVIITGGQLTSVANAYLLDRVC